MGIVTGILAGLQILSAVKSSSSSTQTTKDTSEIQNKLADAEYLFNTQQASEAFVTNLQLNFSTTASEMFSLTGEYIQANNDILFSGGYVGSGASYNSSMGDKQRDLGLQFSTAMTDIQSSREYTENNLSDNYIATRYQLDLDNRKAKLGIWTTTQSSYQAANQNLINGVTSGLGSLYSAFSNSSSGSTNSTLSYSNAINSLY